MTLNNIIHHHANVLADKSLECELAQEIIPCSQPHHPSGCEGLCPHNLIVVRVYVGCDSCEGLCWL